MAYDEKRKLEEVEKENSSVDHDSGDGDSLHDPDEVHGLHRGLKARQISMIALGGAIGTGLIIGSGTALRRGGPLG